MTDTQRTSSPTLENGPLVLNRKDRWDIFVQDLDERLAVHLYDKKEEKLKHDVDKMKVEVVPSETNPDAWQVFFSGRKLYYFDGPDAHRRATRAAADLLEDLQKPHQ